MAEAVKVIVRCRPLNAREKNLNCENVIRMDGSIGQCRLLKPGEPNQPPKTFTFDGVFNTDSITETIYADICFPLVEGVVEGYNGTVFAYGQTGCGKSFTMQGVEDPPTQRGIIPRAFEHVFESITVTETAKFLVHASYLEIYNEEIRDLLSKDQKTKLEVKEHPDRGVYVKDLSMIACNNVKEMEKVMDRGSQNRSVGATLMNADSSRSHSIFTIFIETCEKGEDGEEHIRAGKLNLVDLAGSERQAKTGATGDRLKEATKINLSLSALGNVISALVDGKSKHIPYRDSKLTRLLQDSLGGNTKTLMVACVSPADNNFDETLSTLRYANRAKNIKNKPKINEDPKDALLRQYQDEITVLKQLLTGQLQMTPELIAKLGLSDSNIVHADATSHSPKPSSKEPSPKPKRRDEASSIEEETSRIKKEYEKKLSDMQKKFEEEKLSKERLAEEVAQLQQDLNSTLKATTTKLDGFNNEAAEAILADFQAKVAETSLDESGNLTYRVDERTTKLESSTNDSISDNIPHSEKIVKTEESVKGQDSSANETTTPETITAGATITKSPSKEMVKKSSRADSPSFLRGYAAKGIGILKGKLTGSQQNLSVAISKEGNDFTEVDIRKTEKPVASSKGIVGHVAANIQEEAVRRLNTLQEQLVGPEKQKQDSEELQELKKKHKRRKDHASERQKKLVKEIKKWEGEGIMAKVYNNLQDEIKVKNDRVNQLELELKSANCEIEDIQCEFQVERNDYLDTIRKLEQQLLLSDKLLEAIQPMIRRDCNYSNIDRMKVLSEYDEENSTWITPEIKMERINLPKAGPGKENLSTLKPTSAIPQSQDILAQNPYEREGMEDKYATHLQRNSHEDLSTNYFKSKRAEQLLASENQPISNGYTVNTTSLSKLQPLKPIGAPAEPELIRRPQKLEALPANAFEKKRKKSKKDQF